LMCSAVAESAIVSCLPHSAANNHIKQVHSMQLCVAERIKTLYSMWYAANNCVELPVSLGSATNNLIKARAYIWLCAHD
jgi:hypothetical protein